MFQDTQGNINMVKDLDEISKRDLRKTQEMRETDILVVLEIEEDTSLRNPLRIVSTEEVFNMGMDGVAVEYNNFRRKGGKGHGAEAGLRILDTYTQVNNGLGLRLRYLEAL